MSILFRVSTLARQNETITEWPVKTVKCKKGFRTMDYLQCEPSISCQPTSVNHRQYCESKAKFTCDNKIQTIPYTLVCNNQADCQDNSDELFCYFDCQVLLSYLKQY